MPDERAAQFHVEAPDQFAKPFGKGPELAAAHRHVRLAHRGADPVEADEPDPAELAPGTAQRFHQFLKLLTRSPRADQRDK